MIVEFFSSDAPEGKKVSYNGYKDNLLHKIEIIDSEYESYFLDDIDNITKTIVDKYITSYDKNNSPILIVDVKFKGKYYGRAVDCSGDKNIAEVVVKTWLDQFYNKIVNEE